jgi:hypothetical protein
LDGYPETAGISLEEMEIFQELGLFEIEGKSKEGDEDV